MQRNATRRYLLSCLLLVCFISTATLTHSFATSAPSRSSKPMLESSLPAPWSDLDVGNVGIPGSATYSGGSFTVDGSGGRIWGTSDAFNYVYQPDAGDADIEAHVAVTKSSSSTAKAGIMVRGDLSDRGCYVSMLLSGGSPVL